jgi:hypothetical protein
LVRHVTGRLLKLKVDTGLLFMGFAVIYRGVR